jgi:hypothetical protein
MGVVCAGLPQFKLKSQRANPAAQDRRLKVERPDAIKALLYGEFDPGSERTLAAWMRHASRTIICV